MSRDVTVYTRKGVSLEALLAQLKALGTPLQWTSSFPAGDAANWSEGDFHSPGASATEPGIALYVEDLVDALRKSTVKAYQHLMTDAQQQAVVEARKAYRLSVPWSANPSLDRALVNLASSIAELGNGVIVDATTNRVFNAEEYRRQSAGGSGS